MKGFIKEVIFSILCSLLLILLLSILLSTTKLNENLINPITMGIVASSLFLGGFRISKSKKEKGIIFGSLLGAVYMLILYIISSFLNFDFSLNINSLVMIILGILGGARGGIIGVNF